MRYQSKPKLHGRDPPTNQALRAPPPPEAPSKTAQNHLLYRPSLAGTLVLLQLGVGETSYFAVQSSTGRPGTRRKSRRLREMSSASWVRTIAAIFRSIVPTRIRWRFKSTNVSAAVSSYASTSRDWYSRRRR